MRWLTRPISPSELRKRVAWPWSRAQQNGFEQPHLHVHVGGQAEEQPVLAAGVQVVDQQAHAHAALGGVAQRAQEPAAGLVVGDVVILHVQRGLGAARQLHAGVQREGAQWHQPEAGLVLFGLGDGRDAAQCGLVGRLDRLGLDGLAIHPGQRGGAAGQPGGQQQQAQPAQQRPRCRTGAPLFATLRC